MRKYKVEFEKIETGYVEVFADNEDDAVKKLSNQPSFSEVVETIDYNYSNPSEISFNKIIKKDESKNNKTSD
jgi:hypothetical protein